jgi:hypothetical protein
MIEEKKKRKKKTSQSNIPTRRVSTISSPSEAVRNINKKKPLEATSNTTFRRSAKITPSQSDISTPYVHHFDTI